MPFSRKHYPDADWWWLKIITEESGLRIIVCGRCFAHNMVPDGCKLPTHCGICGYSPRKLTRFVRDSPRRSHNRNISAFPRECDVIHAPVFDERNQNLTDPLADEESYEQVW